MSSEGQASPAAQARAPRPAVTAKITISCTNGFERTVSARAASGIAKALNKFNAFAQTGVICSAA
jgi:hypothetical protein